MLISFLRLLTRFMYGPSGSGSGSTAGSFAPASSSESICSAFSSVSWPTPTPWLCCRTVFFWRGYKWFKTFTAEHWNLCLQVAELDTYAGDIRSKTRELQTTAAQLRNDVASVETNQGMLSDMVDSIHFRLVEMGGYARLSELSPEQRRHMYTQERGNLSASRTMGQQKFLQVDQARITKMKIPVNVKIVPKENVSSLNALGCSSLHWSASTPSSCSAIPN